MYVEYGLSDAAVLQLELLRLSLGTQLSSRESDA